jgi:hypothetical protein
MSDDPMTEAEVKAHLLANPKAVVDTVVSIFKMLGSEFEWSMEHNFTTTETIARLADAYGLPSVGNQSDEDLKFWEELR